ncbi:hypothetical protein MCOR25_004638 [Pyricularia grisea]|uniref:Uncharacterized protein n=1 Tax=Pyricularia grisea TaxID=148305 RepID=A0A6P8AT38_PYRGI|nr:uncharacterized protein PgNI_09368 [Pyricularia grisea]KAI6368519.1 hypothetical protein MCOR25_004638 [Pyricularia grisea]TLD05296.1 hypothetical protein PgNI_09368 [Pyricularia grisea]
MFSQDFDLEVGDNFDFDHVDQVNSKFLDFNSSLDAWDGRTSIPMDIPTAAISLPSGPTPITASAPDTATDTFDLEMVTAAAHNVIATTGAADPLYFGTSSSTPMASPLPALEPQSVHNENIDYELASFMETNQIASQMPVQLGHWNSAFSLRNKPISSAELAQSLLSPISAAPHGRPLHKLRRGRGKDGSRDDPNEFYWRLPGPPPSWAHGRSVFHYTCDGELNLLYKFDEVAFLDYLTQPELVLLIQRTPTLHNHRYPNYLLSPKCRFRQCRALHRTINRGEFRVALSEHPSLYGGMLDPFHCAGYVHLYCLESILGVRRMVELHEQDRLVVHTHSLPMEEKDPMYIMGVPDEAGPYSRYIKWFDLAKSWVNNTLHEPVEGDKTLNWYMAKGVVESQLPFQQRQRQKRGLADFAKHMGNPEEKLRLRCANKAAKAGKPRQEEAHGRTHGRECSQGGSRSRSKSPVRETGRTADRRLRDEPPLGKPDKDDEVDEDDENYALDGHPNAELY